MSSGACEDQQALPPPAAVPSEGYLGLFQPPSPDHSQGGASLRPDRSGGKEAASPIDRDGRADRDGRLAAAPSARASSAAKPSHPAPKSGETILWVCCDVENTNQIPMISEVFQVALQPFAVEAVKPGNGILSGMMSGMIKAR